MSFFNKQPTLSHVFLSPFCSYPNQELLVIPIAFITRDEVHLREVKISALNYTLVLHCEPICDRFAILSFSSLY